MLNGTEIFTHVTMAKQKPDHEIITVLRCMSYEKLEEVSPRSSFLKRHIKLPMLIFLLGTSMQSGFTTVILKIVDTYIQTGLFRDEIGLTIGLCLTIPPSAVI